MLRIGRPLIYHLQYNYSQKLHLLTLIIIKIKSDDFAFLYETATQTQCSQTSHFKHEIQDIALGCEHCPS